MGHLYHGELLNNQRVVRIFSVNPLEPQVMLREIFAAICGNISRSSAVVISGAPESFPPHLLILLSQLPT